LPHAPLTLSSREAASGPLRHIAAHYPRPASQASGRGSASKTRNCTMETVSTNRSHGGTQGVYKHASRETGTEMTFAVFVPDHAPGAKLPVLWYLSGLTCTHANVMEKGEYRAACAQQGIIFVAPDTSPRGDDVPDDEAYD